MKLSLLNSSETVQMSMSGGEAVSLSLKTGAVQTGGSLSIGHGLKLVARNFGFMGFFVQGGFCGLFRLGAGGSLKAGLIFGLLPGQLFFSGFAL